MAKILQLGDPRLEEKSKKVENALSEQVQSTVNDLIELCKENEKIAGGIAAPQIGINQRIFVVRRVDLEEKYKGDKEKVKGKLWEVFINPKILKEGDRKETFWEGCLSVDNGQTYGPVERASYVKVEYTDRDGNKQVTSASDFLAHEILHEYDHLEGILFVKYVKNPKNLWKDKDLDAYIRRHGDVPPVEK
jgi:peptide deformylase